MTSQPSRQISSSVTARPRHGNTYWAVGVIRKPVPDAERFGRVWERVKAYDGAYEMRP